jgi:hypothetical protein
MKERRDELITRRILLLTKTRGVGVGELRGSVSGNVEKTGRRFGELKPGAGEGRKEGQPGWLSLQDQTDRHGVKVGRNDGTMVGSSSM